MTVEEKAEQLVKLTTGNCALDGCVITAEQREELFKQTVAELLKMDWTGADE